MKPKQLRNKKQTVDNSDEQQQAKTKIASSVSNDKTEKFKNRQRCLVVARRGITVEDRHFLKELQILLPHSKKESKLDKHSQYTELVDLAAMKKCPNLILLERKRKELFLYAAKSPIGPTIQFKIQNLSLMMELKFTGNCLKGSRPFLHFDKSFQNEDVPHLQLAQELLTHIFATPKGHPKSKPFFDHIISFYFADGKIWFRHFQIVDRIANAEDKMQLVEIGPRFVMTLIKVVEGAFEGNVLYNNDNYVPKATRIQKQVLLGDMKRELKNLTKLAHKQDSSTFESNPVHKVWFEANNSHAANGEEEDEEDPDFLDGDEDEESGDEEDGMESFDDEEDDE